MTDHQEPTILELTLVRERITSFAVYPFNIPGIRSLHTLQFPKPVTFFVGENGSGKSTLLEAIAVQSGLNAEGGTKHLNFNTMPSHSELFKCIRLTKSAHACSDGFFLRAESFYNVASELDRIGHGDPTRNWYGGKSLHEQSHGESFLSLMENRFRNGGYFLLDEPEAALSIQRQLATLRLFDVLVDRGSQFIIATHSPILLAYPGATIYEFSERGIHPIEYEQTDSYLTMHAFLQHREQMIADILSHDEDGKEQAELFE